MGEGVRVLLQYRPIETLSEHKKQVEIQALSAIHFDTLRIVPHDKIDQLPDDTLYLQSVWKTGDFLNLRYRIDYHSRPHSILLVADEAELSGDTLKVQLRHSRQPTTPRDIGAIYTRRSISRLIEAVLIRRCNFM